MKKLITKNPILNIIIGVLFVSLGIVAIFNEPLFDEGLIYLAAVFVLVFTVIIFQKDLRTYKADAARNTLILAFLLVLIIVLLMMFWDPIDIPKGLGLILYVHGAAHMLMFQFLKKAPRLKRFVLDLFLITLGAYLFFSDIPFIDIIKYAVIGLLIVYGGILLYAGIRKLVRTHKSKPKQVTPAQQPEKPEQKKPDTEQTKTNPAVHTAKTDTENKYTQEQLKKKSVDELKAMCKARSMTGYSGLTKSQLVERIWRYEKEKTT